MSDFTSQWGKLTEVGSHPGSHDSDPHIPRQGYMGRGVPDPLQEMKLLTFHLHKNKKINKYQMFGNTVGPILLELGSHSKRKNNLNRKPTKEKKKML